MQQTQIEPSNGKHHYPRQWAWPKPHVIAALVKRRAELAGQLEATHKPLPLEQAIFSTQFGIAAEIPYSGIF